MSLNAWMGLVVLGLAAYRASTVVPFDEVELSASLGNSLNGVELPFASAQISPGNVSLVRSDGCLIALSSPNLIVHAWDKDAAVYVIAGADGKPGVIGVDDEGNGVVDDRSELGATGSDDRIVTPSDPSYEDARQGKVIGFVISRGAMIPAPDTTTISAPAQVRIDLLDDQQRMASRIIDLTPS